MDKVDKLVDKIVDKATDVPQMLVEVQDKLDSVYTMQWIVLGLTALVGVLVVLRSVRV